MCALTDRVNYFEIGSPEPGKTRDFYAGLFGWPFEEPTGDQPYWMVDEARGGLWDTSASGGQSWAVFYVQVADLAAVVARTADLGGQVVVPVTDGGNIEFAHLLDPHGNRIGIWRPKDVAN